MSLIRGACRASPERRRGRKMIDTLSSSERSSSTWASAVLGFVAYRRTTNLADFILGGRSLGSWVTALSAQASDMSGWLLMGLPGLAYVAGINSIWLVLGLVVGTYLNWQFIASRLRTRTEQLGNSLTMPDYFERRFNDRTRYCGRSPRSSSSSSSPSIRVPASSRRAALRIAVRHALPRRHVLGQRRHAGLHFFGGFLAVSWTDVLQGTLMFFALVLVARRVSPWRRTRRHDGRTRRARPALLIHSWRRRPGNRRDRHPVARGWGWIPRSAAHPCALHGDPFGGRNADRASRAMAGSCGACRRNRGRHGGHPRARPPLTGADSEKVFIVMSTRFLTGAGRHLHVRILAAIMSTGRRSCWWIVAFRGGFYKGLFRRDPGRGSCCGSTRRVLGIAVLAYLLALNRRTRCWIRRMGWAASDRVRTAIVLSLYWDRMTRNGALAGSWSAGSRDPVEAGQRRIFELYEMVREWC